MMRDISIVLPSLQDQDISFVPHDEPDSAYSEIMNFPVDLSSSKIRFLSQLLCVALCPSRRVF